MTQQNSSGAALRAKGECPGRAHNPEGEVRLLGPLRCAVFAAALALAGCALCPDGPALPCPQVGDTLSATIRLYGRVPDLWGPVAEGEIAATWKGVRRFEGGLQRRVTVYLTWPAEWGMYVRADGRGGYDRFDTLTGADPKVHRVVWGDVHKAGTWTQEF